MAFAKSDTTRVLFMEETNWGEVPSAPLEFLRHTGESFAENRSEIESEELTGNRGVSDTMPASIEANGGFNFEMIFGTFDKILAGLLGGSWSTPLAISLGDISASDVDNSLNTAGGDFTVNGPAVGQWIGVSGFTNAANNGYMKVVSVVADKIVVSGATLVTESAPASVDIIGSMVRTGGTLKSFTFEKQFPDITQMFSYSGMVAQSMSLNIATGSVITGSFEFIGKKETRATVSVGTGAPTAANTFRPMTAIQNVRDILIDGAAIAGTYLTAFDTSIESGARSQEGIGQYGAIGADLGTERVSGSMEMYFANADLYDKYANSTEMSIAVPFVDQVGNVMILSHPRLKFSKSDIMAGSKNTDVMAKFELMALESAGYTTQIDVLPAA